MKFEQIETQSVVATLDQWAEDILADNDEWLVEPMATEDHEIAKAVSYSLEHVEDFEGRSFAWCLATLSILEDYIPNEAATARLIGYGSGLRQATKDVALKVVGAYLVECIKGELKDYAETAMAS